MDNCKHCSQRVYLIDNDAFRTPYWSHVDKTVSEPYGETYCDMWPWDSLATPALTG